TAQGLDHGRVGLLAAVLEQRGRVPLNEMDIHTSTVGGVRVVEPAADLGVLLAMASANLDRAVAPDIVACGEVGLVGEVRRVVDIERRLNEAQRLGFRRAIVPSSTTVAVPGLELVLVTHVLDALQVLARGRALNSTAA
ncbi:MAG: DNA repair protein RadA, partial [Actinomycetota bacterium]|nr:DNA repair protein RadA [Actinomycetota bacterium]